MGKVADRKGLSDDQAAEKGDFRGDKRGRGEAFAVFFEKEGAF